MKREPPKEYQFKKGQSGNPNGRPRNIEGDFIFIMLGLVKLIEQARSKNIVAIEKIKEIKKYLINS